MFIYGAALGTVIANASCSIFMIWKIFLQDYLKIGLSKLYMSWKVDHGLLLENKSFILSQIITSLTYSVSSFMYTVILSYYPSEAFNVYVVSSYIFTFCGIFAQNFTGSLIPVVGTYVGAKQYNEIHDFVKKMFLIVAGYGFVIACIVMLGHPLISHWLATESTQVPLISQYLILNSIPWALNLLSLIFVFVAAGSGDSKGSIWLTIVNMYVIVIISLLTIPHLFNNLTTGIFFTLGLIQVLTFISSGGYYLSGRWKKVSLIKQQENEVIEA